MRIWIVCDHEPLPTDPGNRKLMRAGMLSQALAAAGHETTWFNSSFDHYRKQQRRLPRTEQTVESGLRLRVLPAPGYRRNIDPARVFHNIAFSRAFSRLAPRLEPPDVVVAAIPSTEAAAATVRYASERGIPSVLDIYDPWPDSFRHVIPQPTLLAAAPLVAMLRRQARFACTRATSLVGTSEAYLRWGQKLGGRPASAADSVIPLGSEPRDPPDGGERATLLAKMGIKEQGRLVSFVGSWGPTHDLSLVADAAELLRHRDEIRFVMAGDNESQPELAVRFRAMDNVVLPGWLDQRQSTALLEASDIGLLPYRRDAPQQLPNKLFEYMAHGVYQISTLAGETLGVYMATGVGRSVECDASALATAILQHLDAPPPAGAREVRRSVFQQRYSAANIYASMVRHVQAVALGADAAPRVSYGRG